MILSQLFGVLRRDSVVPGILGVSTTVMLTFFLWQSAVNERALIHHAQIVPATLITVRAGREGAEGEYSYETLAGMKGAIRRGYDTLDEIPGNGNNRVVEVEYLPEKPEVNRIKGTGNTSVGEWRFWLAFKCVLLTAFLCGSLWMLVRGLRNE